MWNSESAYLKFYWRRDEWEQTKDKREQNLNNELKSIPFLYNFFLRS